MILPAMLLVIRGLHCFQINTAAIIPRIIRAVNDINTAVKVWFGAAVTSCTGMGVRSVPLVEDIACIQSIL